MSDKVRLTGELNAYDDAPAGTQLPRFRTGVDRDRQTRYHQACDIEETDFGPIADVSILAQDNALAIARAGLPNDGRIHTRHVLRQRERIGVGEPLILNGRIASYRETRRGRLMTCVFAFMRADLTVPLEMEGDYLLPYAEAPAANEKRPAAETKPGPAMTPIGKAVLTPEKVTAYSEEVGNLMHFDPAFAATRGYRAPLVQGVMLLTLLHGALVRDVFAPRELDLEINFRRPVFWDQTLVIAGSDDQRRYECRDEADRIVAEMTVQHLAT